MNNNDENPSTSKLTLTLLDEGLPTQQQPGTLTSGLIAICPKCGYRAKSSDDPLLTKFHGLGECPICGVIPQKYLEKHGKTGSTNSRSHAPAEKNSTSAKSNQPVPKIVMLSGFFAALVALMLLLKSLGTKTPPDTKIAADNTAQAIVASSKPQHAAKDRSSDKGLLELDKLTKGLLEKVWTQPTNNIESRIAMVEKAAVEIANATYNLTDKKVIAAYNRCQYGFEKFASELRNQKEMHERIKSIDDEINSLKKREIEQSNKVDSELQGSGFMEPLRYNAKVTISGETFVATDNLLDEKRELWRKANSVKNPGRDSDICNFYKD